MMDEVGWEMGLGGGGWGVFFVLVRFCSVRFGLVWHVFCYWMGMVDDFGGGVGGE